MSLPLVFNIFDWYWVVADTNPTTQVFQSSSGTMVANTASAYGTWVGTQGSGALSVLGAANNGSGLIRLTTDTNNFVTNDRWLVTGVGGTTEANATWPVTSVDSTHVDLQGSAFVHAYTSGGYIGRGTPIDTLANVYKLIDDFNKSYFLQNASSTTSIDLTSGTPLQITTPMARIYEVNPGTSNGASLHLPAANLPGSPPIGQQIIFKATNAVNSKTWAIRALSGGSMGVGTLGSLEKTLIWLSDNTTSDGSWKVVQIPSAASPISGIASILATDSVSATAGYWKDLSPSGDLTMANDAVFTISKLGGVAFAPASFSPTDQSGAALTFTSVNVQKCQLGNMVHVYGTLTYPATADVSNAAISLPVAVPAGSYATVPGTLVVGGTAIAAIQATSGGSTAALFQASDVAYTNALLSGKLIRFMLVYPAA